MEDPAQNGPNDSAAVLRRARRIADEVLVPAAMTVDVTHQVPPAHLDVLAAGGFYGMAGPREYGGSGLDFVTFCRVAEVLAGACLSTTFVWMQHHGAVRAAAGSTDRRLRQQWLKPLCLGQRRAGVALGGALPGPPLLRARRAADGYVLDGISPWITGWGLIDTLCTAARDEHGNIVWALLDAQPGPTLSTEPLELVAVMASRTVRGRFSGHFVPAERVTDVMPLSEWRARDADGLRLNGSLALGLAARCCALIGPSPLDDQLVRCREALDAGTPETMPAARAAASALAMRATTALVVAQGSKAIMLDQDAQRLAREALFLLVFGSRPAIRQSLSRLLSTRE